MRHDCKSSHPDKRKERAITMLEAALALCSGKQNYELALRDANRLQSLGIREGSNEKTAR